MKKSHYTFSIHILWNCYFISFLSPVMYLIKRLILCALHLFEILILLVRETQRERLYWKCKKWELQTQGKGEDDNEWARSHVIKAGGVESTFAWAEGWTRPGEARQFTKRTESDLKEAGQEQDRSRPREKLSGTFIFQVDFENTYWLITWRSSYPFSVLKYLQIRSVGSRVYRDNTASDLCCTLWNGLCTH